MELIFEYYFFILFAACTSLYELIKYQRGCDAWQATAKMVQPCICLTNFHECTVNCVIPPRNCFVVVPFLKASGRVQYTPYS